MLEHLLIISLETLNILSSLQNIKNQYSHNSCIAIFFFISCILLCYNIQLLYYNRHNTTISMSVPSVEPKLGTDLDISCVETVGIKK
jgi:hypothetical protein